MSDVFGRRADVSAGLAAGGEAGFMDVVSASYENMRLVENWNASEEALRRAYDGRRDRLRAATGDAPENPFLVYERRRIESRGAPRFATAEGRQAELARARAEFDEAISDALERRPDAAESVLPGTSVEEEARRLARQAAGRMGETFEGRDSLDRWLALLGGGIGGSLRDPLAVAGIMAGGGPSAARTAAGRILTVAGREAAINAGLELVAQPQVQHWKKEAGLPHGLDDGIKDVALAAVIGGVLGGGLQGAAEGVRALRGARADTPAPPPDRPFGDTVPETAARPLPQPDDPPEVRAALRELDAEELLERRLPPGLPAVEAEPALTAALRAAEDPELLPVALEEATRLAATPLPRRDAPDLAALPGEPGRPAGTFLFRAGDLGVDPARFQFKSDTDGEGVSQKLRSVTRWDPAKGNQLVVWQQGDGRLFVADGHQRTGLARRLEAGGHEPIEIPGLLFRERDGFSAEDVMVLAAEKNIAEGSGSLLDAAKIMRVRPEVARNLSGIADSRIRQATDAARLRGRAWEAAINEVIEPQQAAIVGRTIPDDEARQLAAIDAIQRGRPANLDETAILVGKVRAAELARADAGRQGSLFGDDPATSTVMEEVRVVAATVKAMRSDRALFARVEADAARIEAASDKMAVDRAAAVAIRDDAGMVMAYVQSRADTAGPVRDALLRLAREVKDGARSYADAARELGESVRRALAGDGGPRRPAGDAGPAAGRGADGDGPAAGGRDGDGAAFEPGRDGPAQQRLLTRETEATADPAAYRAEVDAAARADDLASLFDQCRG